MVTDFGTNRKLIYDFLLVINTNLPPILHRFRYIAVDKENVGLPHSVQAARISSTSMDLRKRK